MNKKFFTLPTEKQRRIINAAYKVFSDNSYPKAPMSEIAEEGNISKSLLFHYFTNKKDVLLLGTRHLITSILWFRILELLHLHMLLR